MNESPPKKRGAPLGNKNALKHGFYARQYKPVDQQDLDSLPSFSLTDEIDLVRVNIRRLLDSGQTVSTFSETLDLVRALTLATANLTRLMRTHNELRHLNTDYHRPAPAEKSELSQRLEELKKALAEKSSRNS